MTAYEFVQGVIIGAAVLLSVLHILRKVMPKAMRLRQKAVAASLSQSARPYLMRKLGSWMMPAESSDGGCGSGCGSCGGCGSGTDSGSIPDGQKSETKPLEFQRRG